MPVNIAPLITSHHDDDDAYDEDEQCMFTLFDLLPIWAFPNMVQCYCSPNPDDVDDDEDVGDGNDGKNYEDDDDLQATW